MSNPINTRRRRFLGTAAVSVGAMEMVVSGLAYAQSAQAGAPAAGANAAKSNASLAEIKQINAGVLNVGYAEVGPATGPVVILLHGWPYDIHSFADVAPRLAATGYRVIVPYLRGYGTTRFLSASAFQNPDHVAIVIDNYRWRLSLSSGEPQYDALERRLATAPVITVPTITLEGDANGASHPEPAAYAQKFVGKYAHRNITGGIGHNLPQEAPEAFADAVIEVAGY
ncbi:MAG: alpha/beta hydrolase [Paraburkholderia sp.]|nr:alpha/beta hydrolase [Paraburkholderia sp.]